MRTGPIDPDAADTCALCGAEKDAIHHIDGDETNDDMKNRLPVCNKCNNRIHKGYNAQYLIWFHLLDPSVRHTSLPRFGRNDETKRSQRARTLDTRLRKAYAAAQDAYDATTPSSDEGETYFSLSQSVSAESKFLRRFKHLAVSKQWTEKKYEHRACPIVQNHTSEYGYTLRLPAIDEQGDKARKRAAYKAFQTEMRSEQGISCGRLRVE